MKENVYVTYLTWRADEYASVYFRRVALTYVSVKGDGNANDLFDRALENENIQRTASRKCLAMR